MDRISALGEILPYVHEFQGQTFVIKMGGEISRKESLENIAKQISLISHIGIKVVLVHGGGPQMDEVSSRLGVERNIVHGRRVTDDQTLEIAKMVFKGLMSTDIVCALKAQGTLALGLSGVDGNLILASRRPPQEIKDISGHSVTVDFQNVGDIRSINTGLIELLLRERYVPVIASLGSDESGNALNINADTIAASVASSLKAVKLIILTNVPGILRKRDDPSSLICYTDIKSIKQMIEQELIQDGMLPKVEACMKALLSGVQKTHIIDGTRPNSLLLELFMNEGVGTMIVERQEEERV